MKMTRIIKMWHFGTFHSLRLQSLDLSLPSWLCQRPSSAKDQTCNIWRGTGQFWCTFGRGAFQDGPVKMCLNNNNWEHVFNDQTCPFKWGNCSSTESFSILSWLPLATYWKFENHCCSPVLLLCKHCCKNNKSPSSELWFEITSFVFWVLFLIIFSSTKSFSCFQVPKGVIMLREKYLKNLEMSFKSFSHCFL